MSAQIPPRRAIVHAEKMLASPTRLKVRSGPANHGIPEDSVPVSAEHFRELVKLARFALTVANFAKNADEAPTPED